MKPTVYNAKKTSREVRIYVWGGVTEWYGMMAPQIWVKECQSRNSGFQEPSETGINEWCDTRLSVSHLLFC